MSGCSCLFEEKDWSGEERESESNLRITFFRPCGLRMPIRVEEREITAMHSYARNFFSTLLSNTALVATVIELALIASAPTSGTSRIPKG